MDVQSSTGDNLGDTEGSSKHSQFKKLFDSQESIAAPIKDSDINNLSAEEKSAVDVLEDMKFSLKKKNDSKTTTETESYTEKEYRDFGWARANNILNAGQNTDYRSKFAAAKTGNSTFNKSKSGEYIIPVSDKNNNALDGVENVLVFAKGTITNPVITSVIAINADNETDLSLIREYIYERELEGIQTETEGVFKRYNSSDRKFKRQEDASGVTHSERHENGSGSSSENPAVNGRTKGGSGSLLSDDSSKRPHSTSTGKQAKRVDGRSSRYRERRGAGFERRKYCQTLKTTGKTERRVILGHICGGNRR